MKWIALVSLVTASTAVADRYEATISLRPFGELARVGEDGAPSAATTPGGGISGGLSYGVRNWLDIGGEVLATGLVQSSYSGAMVTIAGTPRTGDVARTTRLLGVRGGATLRLGVGWVSTIYLGFGVGGRQRTQALLVRVGDEAVDLKPDGGDAKVFADLLATVRLGFERRVNRRWSIGIGGSATHCVAIGAPALDLVEAGISLAYTWYPLW
jgi:hypothetical protein